jgi:hypothetical protein
MRKDYQKYFFEVNINVINLGGILYEESDLRSVFSFPNGWKLLFDCERYYVVAFSLILVSPSDEKFDLALLMELFENNGGHNYGPPTIENYFHFIKGEWDRIFDDEILYKYKYKKLELDKFKLLNKGANK